MKLTVDSFNYLKKRIFYWQELLGLTEWSIQVDWEEKPGDSHVYVVASVEDMRAWVAVSKDWDRVDREFLDDTACHEVLEVMFYKAEELGDARYVRKGEMRAAIHAEINRLVRVLKRYA
ncbi:MAG: hypothetical protein ACW99J_18510 [Candidatus Thorarchaeota archaeon]|jgi:hypothetical protein